MEGPGGEPTKDYSGKMDELKHSEIMLPEGAPAWAAQAYGEEAFQSALKAILAEAAEGRIALGSNNVEWQRELASLDGTVHGDGVRERLAATGTADANGSMAGADEDQVTTAKAVAGADLLPMEVAERMAWARLSERLWNDIEHVETTRNRIPRLARLAREITVALPKALSREAQIDLVRGFVMEAFTSRGTVVDWVLHDKGDGNPHAHLMLPTRFLDVDAWGGKDRRLDDRKEITGLRRTWERHANMILEREGLRERIDMRSLKDQGIQLAPENYNARIAEHAEKAGVTAMEKLRCEEVRKKNQAFLRENPEHVLVLVQSRCATFTKRDLLATLADRLDMTPEALTADMVAAVTGSPDLVPMAAKTPEGEQLYISRARAEQGMRVQADSAALVKARMAPELVAAGDAFETGTGPILVDVGPVVEAREEEARAAAARERRERQPAPAAGGKPQISVDAVREALRARADDLFRDAFGAPVRPAAAEWRAKANEGIAMQMRGEKRGLWRDHTAGVGGDVLDLAARVFCGLDSARSDFPRVLREAAGWCGIAATEAPDPGRLAEIRKERERAAAAEEARDAERRAALVKAIAGHAVPVAGTPAAIYIVGRGLTAAPKEGLAYLPPVPGLGVRSPEAASLVVWARDAEGVVHGGQRILIDTDGAPLDTDVRKPAFGAISGVPARFQALDATLAKGPLVIAEGPESALAAWEATGLETWAVFGVSGFASAPIPEDREVILAPDRDAPESPAGQAFRKAVAEHLERGCTLKVAMAPEPSGSKSDLNDTLQRAGLDAVKAAIEAARPVQAWLPAELNRGQREAAEAMLGTDRLTLVKGHAGTGKTTSLRAVASAWQARGVEVLAGAPSGKATQELARIEGARAATLSAWESRWERGEVPQGPFVFLLDEAGMVGVEQWARVQSRVLAMGGKLVAIGDPEQLRPVGDLSGWTSAEFAANAIPVIDQVLRQNDDGDRAAVTALARGREGIRTGLDHFLQRGAVRLEPEVLDNPVAALAAHYWADPEAAADGDAGEGGKGETSRIALAFSNRDVDMLNDAIRAIAVSKGFVRDADAIEVRIARERRVRVPGGGARTWRTDVTMRVGVGDRILLTRPAPELGLPRSGFGTVTNVAEGRIAILIDGRDAPFEIDPSAFPHLDYGFAATMHKAQGMTADQVSVLPHARMDGHATYVALSRHRERVTVFGRRKHMESAEDFHRMGVRVAQPPVPKTERGQPAIRMPESAMTDRPDWRGAYRGRAGTALPGLAGDGHLMSVASRLAGLLAADRAEGDPLLKHLSEAAQARDDFTAEPRDAVETLVARHGVIRAEELAAALAAPVADPETFLRLFDEAIRHPDLVALPGGPASKEGDAYVYTSTAHLRAELAAVDRAMRMAARSDPETGPAPKATVTLSPSQETALAHAMRAGVDGGALALVTGGPGSGRTRLAAEAARAHEAAGRVVTVIAATEAGRRAFEARGVYPVTLQQWLDEPPVLRDVGDPGHVVIFDDAHALGAFQADAALARAEAIGAGVVAVLDPSRRPQLGGAIFRALCDRVGATELVGLHGTEGPLAETVVGLAAGGENAAAALAGLRDRGQARAAGDREAAIRRVAADYLADASDDRIALAWSRADAAALTDAIRSALDSAMPERAAERPSGPLGDLRPGDRIRFSVAGWCGTATGPSSRAAKERRGMILRGDRAEVLEALPGGGLRMRVTGLGGTRELDVVQEGPLPRWQFAFASTIAAAAGSRHDSVHFLASPGLDRATLAAGAVIATGDLAITLPVPEDRAGATFERIAVRERPARSAADHGFDPALAARAAVESAVPAPVRPDLPTPEGADPDLDPTKVPVLPLGPVRDRRANANYLKAHPEHVLAIVQSDRPVFTEADVRQALRMRLAVSLHEAELGELGDRAMGSDQLVTLATEAPDGAPQYMTTARAETMQEAHSTARKLAAGRFAPGAMPVERGDLFAGLNSGQARAAEAMLGTERLTMVQGHAGTGKTHTLRAVAEAWRARGVEVLAGAPSGKAATELKALDGVEAATLASWEARWQKGDVPRRDGFVFVLDEAGMVGAGAWARIQERVLEMGGKLIAVGDPDQLQPVSDMPGWAIAERAAGQGHVTVIDRVVRQSDPLDAEATRSLAQGGANVEHAVRHYVGKGAIALDGAIRADPFAALARAHADDMEAHEGGSRIAVAYTNRDVHHLNDAIRAEALARGMIDPETVRRYGTVRRVERGEAGRERMSYIPRDLGVGDRVVLRAPHRDLGLPKSSFGTVVRTDEDGIEAVFDGHGDEPVLLDRNALEDTDHGHAATIHKAQGMTADSVFVLPHRGMHRHSAYVALSRHRERLAVFGRAGHLDRPADLVRMAQAAGHLDLDLGDGIPGGARDSGAEPAPWEAPVGLEGRADWQARGAEAGRGGFVGDARLMSVAERVTGLMAAAGNAQGPDDGPDRDPEGLAQDPGKVVDVILRHASVFRAEDVATRLAKVSHRDPDTFLRLFREAMARSDLVVLAEDDGRGGGRVWTTEERLETELDAVDRGIRLALDPAPAETSEPVRLASDFGRKRGLSPTQEAAVRSAARKGRLRLVAGGAGSGKSSVAALVADVHARAGWQVLGVAPTGAGVDGLREAGLAWRRPDADGRGGMRSLTLNGLEREMDAGKVRMDARTLVVVDDAGRIGADRAARLLEKVEASGAKLVAFLDDGAHAPMEAGPVFNALRTRLGASRLDDSFRWSPRRAIVMGELVRGGEDGAAAIEALEEDGCLVAAGDRRRAITNIAKAYAADGSWDKVVVAWSRKDVDALNGAIRKRLDRQDPERREHEPDAEGPLEGLRPGDRIRFTSWTPRDAGVAREHRFFAGELAEYQGRDQSARATFRVQGRDGAMRDMKLPQGTEIPDWRFGFAGTIAGETGRAADSVHMLASPGMSRQLLATGARLHRDDLRIVVPVAKDRLRRAMGRIVERDATPESVLDHGFDPALGAREAMRGRSLEIETASAAPMGVSGALERLREIARLGEPVPLEAPLRGLEGEVMAEVIGASVLRHGAAPEGRDRLALESHVTALASPLEWRQLLKQAPSGMVQEADALALKVAGTVPGDPSGRAPTAARILARGALTARALGEGTVAGLFEDGLRLYGRRASLARAVGRPEELVAPVVSEEEADARAEPAGIGMRPAQAGSGSHMPLSAPNLTHRSRRRGRGAGMSRALGELDVSDERLAEAAFGIFLPKGKKRRPRPNLQSRFERCREELRLGGDWSGRAEAIKAARDAMAGAAERASRPAQVDREGTLTRGPAETTRDLALQLAMAITARVPMGAAVHGQNLQNGLAALLDRTDGASGDGDPVAGIAALQADSGDERFAQSAAGSR